MRTSHHSWTSEIKARRGKLEAQKGPKPGHVERQNHLALRKKTNDSCGRPKAIHLRGAVDNERLHSRYSKPISFCQFDWMISRSLKKIGKLKLTARSAQQPVA